jgi:hypothetical protein
LRLSLGSVTGLEPSFLEGTFDIALRISVGDRRLTVDDVLFINKERES